MGWQRYYTEVGRQLCLRQIDQRTLSAARIGGCVLLPEATVSAQSNRSLLSRRLFRNAVRLKKRMEKCSLA